MTPLGWGWSGFVWAYALLWALVNDRVKLLAYRILDPAGAKPGTATKIETQPEAKLGQPPVGYQLAHGHS
jgi:H+-transporting ATPase